MGFCVPVRPTRLMSPPQFQQILEAQLARSAKLGERLEEIGRLQLDAPALRSQLNDQKVGLEPCSGPGCSPSAPKEVPRGRRGPTWLLRHLLEPPPSQQDLAPTHPPVSSSCSRPRSCSTGAWWSVCWASQTRCSAPALSPCGKTSR